MLKYFKSSIPIWVKNSAQEMNQTLLFSDTFKKRGDMSLTITACNFYRVFLNGKFLAFGPARAAEGYYRVDNIPLTQLLEDNVLIIEVNVYRCTTLCAVDMPGFVQYEVSSNGNFVTGSLEGSICYNFSARTQNVLRFSFQRAFTEDYCYPCLIDDIYSGKMFPFQQIETVYAGEKKLWDRGVSVCKYGWQKAQLIEGGRFWETEDFEPFRDRSMVREDIKIFSLNEIKRNTNDLLCSLKYEKKIAKNLINAGEYALYKNDILRTGFIKSDINAITDSEIIIFFEDLDLNFGIEDADKLPANIQFNRDRLQNHIRINLKAGRQSFMSFEPYSVAFIKVLVLSGEIEIDNIGVIKYQNEDCDSFDLDLGEDKLNLVMSAAVETFKQNAADLLTDCPSRERAGWLCDSFFLARSEKFFTGKNDVELNFLQNYAFSSQNPNIPQDMLDMCYPSMNMETYIENWALWYIVELYDCVKRIGKVPFKEQSLGKVKGLLKYFKCKENEYGLLENSGGWIFVEWSGANDDDLLNDINFPSNMLYAHALECASKLLEDPALLIKSTRTKEAIRLLSFNGEFFEDNCVREEGKLVRKGNVSETCQYYAFYFGTATKELHPKLFDIMFEEFGPGKSPLEKYPFIRPSNMFIGNYLRLDYLLNKGYYAQILGETTGYFYKMAQRTGTLWENDDSRASVCHGFASYIGYIMYRCLDGLGVIPQKNDNISVNNIA